MRKKRGLPASGRPDEDDELAFLDVEIDAVNYVDGPVGLADIFSSRPVMAPSPRFSGQTREKRAPGRQLDLVIQYPVTKPWPSSGSSRSSQFLCRSFVAHVEQAKDSLIAMAAQKPSKEPLVSTNSISPLAKAGCAFLKARKRR